MNFSTFTKDFFLQQVSTKVYVMKHYQVKDHRMFTASIGSVSFPDKGNNITATLKYKDDKAKAENCPSEITFSDYNIMETNEDTWKVTIIIPGSKEPTKTVGEFVIWFTVDKYHL